MESFLFGPFESTIRSNKSWRTSKNLTFYNIGQNDTLEVVRNAKFVLIMSIWIVRLLIAHVKLNIGKNEWKLLFKWVIRRTRVGWEDIVNYWDSPQIFLSMPQKLGREECMIRLMRNGCKDVPLWRTGLLRRFLLEQVSLQTASCYHQPTVFSKFAFSHSFEMSQKFSTYKNFCKICRTKFWQVCTHTFCSSINRFRQNLKRHRIRSKAVHQILNCSGLNCRLLKLSYTSYCPSSNYIVRSFRICNESKATQQWCLCVTNNGWLN